MESHMKLVFALGILFICAVITMHTTWVFEMRNNNSNKLATMRPSFNQRHQVLREANRYFEKDLPRLKRPMHEGHIKVFVVGPESSGTRYLTRGIAQLIDVNTTWDGEIPVCKRFRERGINKPRTYDIVHISLPLGGGTCNELDITPVPEDFETCERHDWGRYRVFYDTFDFLARNPHNARTIFITRDRSATIKSKLKYHCPNNPTGAGAEFDLALTLIRKHLLSNITHNSTLEIEYEEFDNFPLLTWLKIVLFLDLHVLDDHDLGKLPRFITGNQF